MENNSTPNIQPAPSQAPSKKPGKVGAFFYGLLLIAIYLVVVSVPQLFVLVPVMVKSFMEAQGDPLAYQDVLIQEMANAGAQITISTVIGTLLAVILMVIWYYFGVYRKNKKLGNVEKVAPKLLNAKSILFLLTGSIAGYAIAILLMDLTEILMPSVFQVVNQSLGMVVGGVEILGLVLTLILAPIGEEVTLRGLFMNRAQKSYSLVGCMVLSGILFGIYHLNPIQGLYAIPMGMFFGFVSYKYKSVIPCIICHFINNLIAMLSGFVPVWNNAAATAVVLVVFGAAAVFIGSKIAFLKGNDISKTEVGNE